MRILGIDPGLSGGLALIDDGKLIELIDLEASDNRINAVHIASLRSGIPTLQCVK